MNPLKGEHLSKICKAALALATVVSFFHKRAIVCNINIRCIETMYLSHIYCHINIKFGSSSSNKFNSKKFFM